MTVIYLDECGFTGDDLADRATPIFVVASHDIKEDDATAWKMRFFGAVRASELKHNQLQRRRTHHRAVYDFLVATLADKRVKASVIHKRYALVAKLIDWVAEPAAYATGLDLYEGGANTGLANVIYHSLGARDESLLVAVTDSFQAAARERSEDAVQRFHDAILSDASREALGEICALFDFAIHRFHKHWITELPADALNLSLPAALNVCYAWRRRGLTEFSVVHDRSSAMANEKSLWDVLLSKDAPPALVGHGSYEIPFPIGVTQTVFEDSKTITALQLADILAGSLARWTKWKTEGRPAADSYAVGLDPIWSKFMDSALDMVVWPSTDVSRRADESPGVVSPMDYLAHVIRTKP